ncbi:MAG: hypothetical protein ABFD98_15550 [Syntrophobacteraceae bacterium]
MEIFQRKEMILEKGREIVLTGGGEMVRELRGSLERGTACREWQHSAGRNGDFPDSTCGARGRYCRGNGAGMVTAPFLFVLADNPAFFRNRPILYW